MKIVRFEEVEIGEVFFGLKSRQGFIKMNNLGVMLGFCNCKKVGDNSPKPNCHVPWGTKVRVSR